jgi:hypothetical protein
MRRGYLAALLSVAASLGVGVSPARAQGPAITPRKPILIVSGTAMGFTMPGVIPVEELVIHNDGLVTLETAADTENCRALRRFVPPADVERLRSDLLAAGAFVQGDFNTGQTADLPHTTVTIFLGGGKSSRTDQTNSFTYERLTQLPQRLTVIRARIRTFVEATFPDFTKHGCSFPF